MANVDFKALSSVYLRMAACMRMEEGDIPRLDPVTLIPRVLSQLREATQEMETLSIRLVEYSERMGLGTGRRPQIVACIAVLIAHVACKGVRPNQTLIEHISSTNFFSSFTLRKGYSEWTEHLIERAHMFPWLMDVDRRNLHKQLFRVIKTLELPHPETPSNTFYPTSSEISKDKVKEVDQLMEELLA
jgi:hypothetical protein